MTKRADDLTVNDLVSICSHIRPWGSGPRLITKDTVQGALEKHGFPRWLHGKQYAKTQVGKVLDRLRREGLAEKALGGWMLMDPAADPPKFQDVTVA